MTSNTESSSFGYSHRESHDSSRFYDQFDQFEETNDSEINHCELRNRIERADSRNLLNIPDNSVALVVTSPPYFAAKEYEVDEQGFPLISFANYVDLLTDVFSESFRVLEPGGRIAINVANIGRRPYRSLSSIVIHILEQIGFALRGEIIWIKATGARGNLAWGSFQSAANPVLRDVTERVIVASKGQFGRAISKNKRSEIGLPYIDTISKEDFMEWTLDTWSINPESAKRIGHPAPFPVELPRRLIELYSYSGDLILDPFCGSGTSCVAAMQSGRDYLGFDIDQGYVDMALARVSNVQQRLSGI